MNYKITILNLLLILALPLLSNAQKTYVPDDSFENYIEVWYGGDGIANNDSVLTANINTITILAVNNIGISNLKGIEGFTALEDLRCHDNLLDSLDVSSNTALIDLDCENNLLTYLNISGLTNLTSITCYNNQLTNIDISTNTALLGLSCHSNPLGTLDLSANVNLQYLECYINQLTNLDLSTNIALLQLWCGANQLTSLDLSNNTALEFLVLPNNQLTSLDVSNNTNLWYISCSFNQISILNTHPNLESLICDNNQLTTLDLKVNTILRTLNCNNNQLTSLDLRNGNNHNFYGLANGLDATNNPNLTCISVDDVSWAQNNWILYNGGLDSGSIDSTMNFSSNCLLNSIEELTPYKTLVKIVDILGKEVKTTSKNKILFYIYEDGSVEKRIVN